MCRIIYSSEWGRVSLDFLVWSSWEFYLKTQCVVGTKWLNSCSALPELLVVGVL